MRACNPSGDNKVMGHWAGLGKDIYWPACSKSGVECSDSAEACGSDTLRVEETA